MFVTVHYPVNAGFNLGRLGSGYDFRKGHETVKAIYPVALTLPTEGGAAAQIYDWTITNSRKPEMAINYFFARMGLFGGAVVNYRRDGQACGPEGRENSQRHQSRRSAIEDAPDYAIVFNLPHTFGGAVRVYDNFVRIHKTLRPTPAMAANVTKRLWEIGDIVDVLEAWEANNAKKIVS